MELKKYITITRPQNGAIAAFGVLAGYTIAAKIVVFNFPLAAGMISAFLITAAGNAINDYFDSQIDEKLGRQKFRNESEKNEALLLSAFLFAIGAGVSTIINAQAFAIAITVSALLILYSGVMQNFKFLGNYVVALGTALTLIYGAAIVQNYSGILLLAGSAFFANVAREIIKDVEDVEGDWGVKLTLPMLASFSGIKKIVLLTYIIALTFAGIAFFTGVVHGAIFIILFLAAAIIFLNSFILLSGREFTASQKFSKYGMLAALVAFIAGSI